MNWAVANACQVLFYAVLSMKQRKVCHSFLASKEKDSSMSDQEKKEATAKEDENGQPLDEEVLDKIVGGAGPSPPPSYAPDGTILPPS